MARRTTRRPQVSPSVKPDPGAMPWRLWSVPDIQGLDIQDGIPPISPSPPHFHHALEIGFVTEGAAGLTCFGERRIIGGDSYSLLPPGQVHIASWESEAPKPLVFFLSQSHVDEARSAVTKREASYRDYSWTGANVVGALKTIYRAVVHRAPILEQQEGLLETLVLIEQRRASQEIQDFNPEPAAVSVVRDYLESNYRQNVTLEQLTALTSLSRFRLVRVFRRATGLPPHAYQSRLRVLHAQAALRMGCTISAAAWQSGFADQSHLTRFFKRFLGVTPGDYVKHSASARMRMV